MSLLPLTMRAEVRVVILICLATCGVSLPPPPHFLLLDVLHKMPGVNQDMLVPGALKEDLYEEPRTSRIIQDILAEIRRKEIKGKRGKKWESLVRVL